LRQGQCPAASSAPRTSNVGGVATRADSRWWRWRGCNAGRQQVVALAVSAFLDGNSAVLPCGDDAAFLGDDIISWSATAWVSTTPRGRQQVAAKAVKTWPARRRGGRPVSCAACCAHTEGLPVPRRGEAGGKHGGAGTTKVTTTPPGGDGCGAASVMTRDVGGVGATWGQRQPRLLMDGEGTNSRCQDAARLLRRAVVSPWCGARRKQRSGTQTRSRGAMRGGKRA
jgi:hypothetical protein